MNSQRQARWLEGIGGISCCLYLFLAITSRQFDLTVPRDERPIELFLVVLATLFALYWLASWLVLRGTPSRRLIAAIWVNAILFRLVLIPSTPILEIDIYRYLWDGASCRVGISPYRFSPNTSKQAELDPNGPAELNELVRLRESDRGLATILRRIHFSDLTTIYPPVSQVVFASASWTLPVGNRHGSM